MSQTTPAQTPGLCFQSGGMAFTLRNHRNNGMVEAWNNGYERLIMPEFDCSSTLPVYPSILWRLTRYANMPLFHHPTGFAYGKACYFRPALEDRFSLPKHESFTLFFFSAHSTSQPNCKDALSSAIVLPAQGLGFVKALLPQLSGPNIIALELELENLITGAISLYNAGAVLI